VTRPLPDESVADLGGVRTRFRACVEGDSFWRRNALVDLKFRAGTDGEVSYQWPEDAQSRRNVAGRPFLTINRIDPFLKQVENQARQANIAIQVVPLKGAVSEAGAEARQGLIRHVMNISDGEVVGDMVFSDALTVGKGWCQLYTEYDPDDESGGQEVYVRAIPSVFDVYSDPAATTPDRRDMRFAFVVETLPREEFDKVYPDSGLGQGTLTMASLGADDRLAFFPGGSVLVADYYEVIEDVTKVKGVPRRKVTAVRWQKITGLEILFETVIPITRIPLVPEFGDQYRINGRVDYLGMVRNMREPQRLFNFSATSLAEQEDLAPNAEWVIAARQVEGLEQFWNTRERLAYKPYKDTDDTGARIEAPPPFRDVANPAISATVEALQMSDMYLQETAALFNPSLGKQKGDQSGKAIQSLQQQGEIGNFNFIDNHKRFLRSLGSLILEAAAVYYDTARVRRIIGKEDTPKTVIFHAGEQNAPTDPDDVLIEQGIDSVHDLKVGRYDVTVTTGPDFLSRRQQAIAAMIDVGKVAPQTVPVWIDLFFKNSDFPGALEIYERMKRTISAQFQESDEEDQQNQVMTLKQQMQQLGQQHDLLIKELNAKNDYIKTDQAKYQSQQAIKQAEFGYQLELQKLKNAATISVAEINAQTKGVISAHEAQHEALALAQSQAHDALQAEMDRGHEFAMAHVTHAQGVDAADQQHQQALEQSDQATAGQMALQDNAPTPTPGAGA
jgi:hypothetical protein